MSNNNIDSILHKSLHPIPNYFTNLNSGNKIEFNDLLVKGMVNNQPINQYMNIMDRSPDILIRKPIGDDYLN